MVKKSKKKKKFKVNSKVLIILALVVCLYCGIVIGGTFAYLYIQETDEETINGDMAVVEANLVIDKIVPTTNLKLVPLLDEALGNALAGVGGSDSCVDSLGNLSCEVYKITLENIGTTNLRLTGDITLVARGEDDNFNNLKWEELEDVDTRKNKYVTNGMSPSVLDRNFYLAVGDTKTYYIAVWISENDTNQVETDKGKYTGIVHFYAANGEGVTAEFGNVNSGL